MLKEEIMDFLQQIPPFHFLDQEEMSHAVADISMDYYPSGTRILQQDGPPSDHLCVIKKGGVKVYTMSEEEGETVVDYRSEGELFGMLSLMSGDRSRANVEAIEDTICYLIPKSNILDVLKKNGRVNEYFLKSFFINFLDKTTEERRAGQAQLGGGERLLFSTPVGEIIRGKPMVASREVTIREGALIMAKQRISSLVIGDADGNPVGMVTDRDLREKVVATGMSVEEPLGSIMSSSLVTVEADENCFEALVKMIRHKIHHILVMENGTLRGMLTNHDFMVLQGTSPTLLVKEIGKIKSLDDLQVQCAGLHQSVATLLRHGAKAHNVCGIITELAEKIVNSVLDFLENERGKPPVSYGVFIYGAGGRRELTLNTRLQLGLVYQDGEGRKEEAEKYFNILQEKLNETLANCLSSERFSMDIDHIKSMDDWLATITAPVSEETSGFRAGLFEMRPIRGEGRDIIMLREKLVELATRNRDFIELVATATVQNRPPLGFFKQFVVEKGGQHKDELNLVEKGIKPMVDAVRLLAFAEGCRELSTKRRLRYLRKKGFDLADDVAHALGYLVESLIEKQLQQRNEGQEPDNFINPDSLGSFERKTLKEAFSLINSLYEIIEERYRTARIR
jgi:CBS domain-containing protein